MEIRKCESSYFVLYIYIPGGYSILLFYFYLFIWLHWVLVAACKIFSRIFKLLGFPGSSVVKEFACNAGDPRLTPGSARSAGEGDSYPLQYSRLENSVDSVVHGVTKNQTRLSGFHFPFTSEFLVVAWGVWDLVPQPGIEFRSPAWGTQSFNHRTTREVPILLFKDCFGYFVL